ncbi:MAG: hypothetical protein PUC82_05500 [bacterium]|nr:hypothetical protein [bacterium]
MMQVQKGQVKYKDRSDIICTYGINDAGKQYYFLDGEKLSNGNCVASTALVEAIDPLVVASNIGVISSDGDIVVPFENKAIKPISDKAILVEKAIPTTQSVIDSVNMRKDPLAATKLVTTPATIKDRMNAKMGNGGRFIFNDQFSEASVFDLDGNNLLDNEYYSFIGLNNGTLYMSKNTVDSVIDEYKLGESKEEKASDDELLDVQEAKVSPEVIDKAMESSNNAPVTKSSEEPEKLLHPVSPQVIDSVDEFKDRDIAKENTELPKKSDKDTRVSLFEGLKFDDVDNTTSELNADDTIIEDTAVMLSKLIKKNKEQRDMINSYQTKMNDLLAFKRQAFSENQKLIKENETLKKRIASLESDLAVDSEKLEKLSAQVAGKDNLAKLLVDAKDLLDE